MLHRFELIDIHVAQRRLGEEARAGFALLATRVVFAAHQIAAEVRVDDHHRDIFRH